MISASRAGRNTRPSGRGGFATRGDGTATAARPAGPPSVAGPRSWRVRCTADRTRPCGDAPEAAYDAARGHIPGRPGHDGTPGSRGAVRGVGLERALGVRTLRAFNKLLRLQNDLINRHDQGAEALAAIV